MIIPNLKLKIRMLGELVDQPFLHLSSSGDDDPLAGFYSIQLKRIFDLYPRDQVLASWAGSQKFHLRSLRSPPFLAGEPSEPPKLSW